MSEVVQAYDPNEGDYVAIEVRTNTILGRQSRPWVNTATGQPMEEIEPLERIQPVWVGSSDPLRDFR